MAKSKIFDETKMVLGEGMLWHPLRESLIWFDRKKCKMFERQIDHSDVQQWSLKEPHSAAGWIDKNQLIVASDSALSLLDMRSGARIILSKLEASNRFTRANEGSADPYGGFWVSTMGINGEPNLGAIYRYHDGELRRLFRDLNTPNAICFAPDGQWAYYGDSQTHMLYRVQLDWQGWPKDTPQEFISTAPHAPYGAVTDKAGNIWNAQRGHNHIMCYSPDGAVLQSIDIDSKFANALAFGGKDFQTLYIMSAVNTSQSSQASDGQILTLEHIGEGKAENTVLID